MRNDERFRGAIIGLNDVILETNGKGETGATLEFAVGASDPEMGKAAEDLLGQLADATGGKLRGSGRKAGKSFGPPSKYSGNWKPSGSAWKNN